MSPVGTSSTMNAQANRASVCTRNDSGAASYSARYSIEARSNAAGVANADAPMSSSTAPNAESGRLIRASTGPASQLPSASPAMNAASTVPAAYAVTPKTKDSWRIQRTW